jgi:hypothetical protein
MSVVTLRLNPHPRLRRECGTRKFNDVHFGSVEGRDKFKRKSTGRIAYATKATANAKSPRDAGATTGDGGRV